MLTRVGSRGPGPSDHGAPMRARIVTFGTIAAVTLAVAFVAAPSASAVKAKAIDRVLTEFDSPLTGHGTTFLEEGKKNGIHPLFLVSIAGFESTLGKAETCGRKNPFGWGPCNDFKTWKAAIRRVALGLRRGTSRRASTARGKSASGTAGVRAEEGHHPLVEGVRRPAGAGEALKPPCWRPPA